MIALGNFAKWNGANTACTRLVGVGAFLGSLRGWIWFRQSSVISSRPPAGNASRWAVRVYDTTTIDTKVKDQ